MPGFDQRGPMGAGPMTGGARGRCTAPAAEYGRTRWGAGGFGLGRGNRYGARGGGRLGRRMPQGYDDRLAPGNPADELDQMRTATGRLKATLQTINKRIDAMEKQF